MLFVTACRPTTRPYRGHSLDIAVESVPQFLPHCNIQEILSESTIPIIAKY